MSVSSVNPTGLRPILGTMAAQALSFLCVDLCPGPHSVDEATWKLRGPPASASLVLGLKVWPSTPDFEDLYLRGKINRSTFLSP